MHFFQELSMESYYITDILDGNVYLKVSINDSISYSS